LEYKAAEIVSDRFDYVGQGDFFIELGQQKAIPDFVDESTQEIVEVLGCFWHGCPECYPEHDDRYDETMNRIQEIESEGWTVREVWECDIQDWRETPQ
jgi:G:T-mismatch repair DNA endonuclease (very short patch repair protein)